MKFNDIEQHSWDELKPYLDTCLLPVTGLSGVEAPWEAVVELERLRDALDLLEIPFKGRVVTYPALHYGTTTSDPASSDMLDSVCANLKASGFRYVVLVTARSEDHVSLVCRNAELILRFTPDELESSLMEAKQKASAAMTKLWSGSQ
ncbi:DUF2487 family protein [Paenibacillus cremeus]|uniref:DUF2487 family protein n=1 Tax=Paenibacillus cremeus TaxID=2163881 RepID=A0A559KHM6_9BACL|nr:DUF2487 family protein [Paenibacillus cremeus]TVY11634.1 DUF2487 family protein [Paenibacillus cremeus]